MSKYVTLLSSLPPIGKLYEAKQTPISRLKLENRLKMLDPQDRLRLNQILNLISWSEQPLERTDTEFVPQANRFLQEMSNRTLKEIVTCRLDLRTIIAALRRRQRGEDAPAPGELWGVGDWVGYIQRHWNQPALGLGGMFPWVAEAERLLADGDLVELERLQFEVNWKMLDRLGLGHYFDFEAVVIYLMRWSMVARWCCYDGPAAVQRFRQLVEAGMEEFTDVFAGAE